MLLVALVTKECLFCKLLLDNWPTIINTLAIFNLHYPTSTEETKSYIVPPIFVKNGSINAIYPSSLMRYCRKYVIDQWYPMIMLVDKKEWDDNRIVNPIIMNSMKNNDKVVLSIKYDTRIIESFKKWVEDVLKLNNVKLPILTNKLVCKNVYNLISIY